MIKFADEAFIIVSSGRGGDGCVAFRREKFIPLGGPAGGDGGRGGDVIFEVRRNVRTLANIRFQQNFKAESGQNGMGKNKHGRDGADVIIPIPPGSIIKDADTGEIIKDFGYAEGFAGGGRASGDYLATSDGENPGRWTFLHGGKGGQGNTHFKTSVNQAPRQFTKGKPGESRRLRVELQLIADIGFVGFPNAGKSSLLDNFTNARPKIAPYPFTTKIPNLGVLYVHERDIILADIPGIIEGAHEGAGLGINFLKHIARTSILAFLVDLSDENWQKAFPTLLNEVISFSPELGRKRRILIGTKLDLPETEGRLAEFRAAFPEEEVTGISVFSGEGLADLKERFLSLVLEEEKARQEKAAAGDDLFGGAPASGSESGGSGTGEDL